jgi:hypothetical protein
VENDRSDSTSISNGLHKTLTIFQGRSSSMRLIGWGRRCVRGRAIDRLPDRYRSVSRSQSACTSQRHARRRHWSPRTGSSCGLEPQPAMHVPPRCYQSRAHHRPNSGATASPTSQRIVGIAVVTSDFFESFVNDVLNQDFMSSSSGRALSLRTFCRSSGGRPRISFSIPYNAPIRSSASFAIGD